jgi:tetratricopeptide (TPR) repeat protein
MRESQMTSNPVQSAIESTSMGNAFRSVSFLLLSVAFTAAAPLDDQIASFKSAPTQTEDAVSKILQSGITEHRSAQAFAAVKPWLAANPTPSQNLVFYAAQSAEYAGDWSSSVSFYRKLLKNPSVDANLATEAVPATYRLLINHLGDADAAYLFMREDGNRLRTFGRANQFDAWFLERAEERGDLIGWADRLAAIHNSSDPVEPYAGSLVRLLGKLESFDHGGEALFISLKSLAAAKRITPEVQSRLSWVTEIVPFNAKVAELVGLKMEVGASLFDGPLRAAEALVAVMPYEGSIIVAEGWMHFNAGDSGVFATFVNPGREKKAAPVLNALQTMSADQVRGILERNVVGAKGRKVADYLFSPAELRTLVQKSPAIFNSLSAPDVPLFDKTLTAADAKVLAPNLARNPHMDAALVRAFAKDERRASAVIDEMMKTEMWRFGDVKGVSDAIARSGMFENDGNQKASDKKYAQLDARYQQLKKQVAKGASANDRLAAFNTLYKELLSPAPSIPGALPLWDEIFVNAPDPERADILISMTADFQGDRLYLLKRAGRNCNFDKQTYAALYLGPDFVENWIRWGAKQTRKALPKFAAHVQGMLGSQMKSGTLSEPILGMWLYSAEPGQKETAAFMAELVASPAYAKVDPAYRQLAARGEFFGESARIAEPEAGGVSAELLALGDGAPPAQVEAAFKTAVDRASKSPTPVAILGLQKLAALPGLTGATRDLALSLFKENSPLGPYPSGQGYEALVQRLAKDLMDAKEWGTIETYAAGLWRGAGATDDGRFYKGADALSQFAEAAQEAGSSSIAMTVTRCGTNSYTFTVMVARTEDAPAQIIGRVRQAAGKAAVAIGAVEIPVDESNPAFPIYKSNSEFVLGNVDSAWSLYEKNADQLEPVMRELSVEYGFWLLQRNTETGASARAENLVKQLTIWSRQAEGTFTAEQEARLKIAYADLAFKKGALPTSRAWYRKVADAAEYEGSEIHLTAALGSVMVDRVSKDFGGAMTELDKLMRLTNPDFRIRVRYARAEVFMDQENYADALGEIEAVLRQEPKHADALILRGKIQYEMRKLVEASEIELGPSQDNTVIVPGEAVKINLRDPTLNVSGVGADIEVEIWAKSGDKERVLLNQLGDSKEKFRAEVPTALGPPIPGDKILQILGKDEIRFGYSERFRAKMDDLPADPDAVIGVSSDAYLSFSAGAFPPREGERRLNIEELGLSTSQASLGTRAVRPGNPVYLRVTDPDQSKTSGIDEITVSLQASSGDEIRQLVMKETAPYSGEFEAVVPTTGAQALAFASESAPGRDPNMAISSQEYPGWQGNVGDKNVTRNFGIDLNDNVAIDKISIDTGGDGQALTHFVLQTSMNGKDWTTRSRYPDNTAPWDGRPRVTSFPTYAGGKAVSVPEGRNLPEDWHEIMELTSARPSVTYLATTVKSLSAEPLPMVETGHPGYSGLVQYRALFYQPAAAIRRFQLTGYPATDDKGTIQTIFLIDGQPAGEESGDPLLVERELAPGLHEIQVWRHEGRDNFLKRKPVLLCDEPGKEELIPCPDAMFDPTTFPEGVRALIPQPAVIKKADDGKLEVAFGDKTRARLVRLVIQGFEGVAPTVHKVTLSNREGVALLPVAQDYRALRENTELEVLPGDQITARYEDPISATPKRTRHEQRLTVAFNDAVISASFLNYKTTEEGRILELEPIRRFRFDDAVAIVIDDADMDGTAEMDTIDVKVVSSGGSETTIQAVETEEHSGRFIGRIFPVSAKPSRSSEIELEEGGTLTATYLDVENLNPGIPTERAVTISHAQYVSPGMETYTMSSELLPISKEVPVAAKDGAKKKTPGPEIMVPRRTLDYTPEGKALNAVVGASLRFDVVVPHLALAGSSEIAAYVQTDAGRKALKGDAKAPFDVSAPGTLKLTGTLSRGEIEAPSGYKVGKSPLPPTNEPPLEEGRFSFSVPLILDDLPNRSFATNAAEALSDSALPDGLAVRSGDTVHVAYAYKDEKDQVQWKTADFKVVSHAFLDVMDGGYDSKLSSAFVGEKVYLRLLDRGLDRGSERDVAMVTLASTSGTKTTYELQETESHSGIFKSVFALSYADGKPPAKLPPVALNGFPVGYGEDVIVSYSPSGDDVEQSLKVTVNMGADGAIEPFSKRFTGDEMAVRTSFTLAECFFELAKKHREMDQESLARREIGQARKLLAEAVATHRDDDLRAHAEYLLGNLSQEFADLSKNEEAKLPMYQDALARFSKIPTDYPDTEFAPKAQFKTALVYEKMGEIENSVEEYVKLAYKYPDNELLPTVMSRLGGYFQTKGIALKKQADPLREKEDEGSKAEVLRLDELSYPEFLNAAMVFSKLQERFPDDALAGLAGLRASQNYMRARQYSEAIRGFALVYDNEAYDGRDIRSQALYWSGLSQERLASTMTTGNYKGIGASMNTAYQTYRRVTFDFPDSIWAKYARGRLADPAFADIIEKENLERERMIEALKEMRKK